MAVAVQFWSKYKYAFSGKHYTYRQQDLSPSVGDLLIVEVMREPKVVRVCATNVTAADPDVKYKFIEGTVTMLQTP